MRKCVIKYQIIIIIIPLCSTIAYAPSIYVCAYVDAICRTFHCISLICLVLACDWALAKSRDYKEGPLLSKKRKYSKSVGST